MIRCLLPLSVALLAALAVSAWGQQPTAPHAAPETPQQHRHHAGPAPAVALVVHVRNGSTELAAGGLPVTLFAEVQDRWIPIITDETQPDGTVTMTIPAEMAARLRFACQVIHQDRPFYGDAFEIDPDSPVDMTVVTVYDPMPRLGLPWWTAAALAALFVAALTVLACRKSDRQLI
jgi:hypothetical protein